MNLKCQNLGQELYWNVSPKTSPDSDRNLSETNEPETKTFIYDLELLTIWFASKTAGCLRHYKDLGNVVVTEVCVAQFKITLTANFV